MRTLFRLFNIQTEQNTCLAFTLAEVLITLGIIGIVAAMTLPAIIQRKTEKETVARVQKAYSSLQQAYLLAVQADGTPDEWGATGMYEDSSHIFLANKFIPYLKISRNCVGMSQDDVKKNCTKKFSYPGEYASVRMYDGTTIIFRIWNGKCTSVFRTSPQLQNVCGEISIDTNATGNPDIYGKDIFVFYLTKTGFFPIGTEADGLSMAKYCTNTRTFGKMYGSFYNGHACSAWLIYNENMEYLRCSDLNWSGKKKCGK